MPSQKILKQKQEVVAKLAEDLKTAVAGVLVDYKGITVAGDTKLRRELRQAGVKYVVVKNTLLAFAFENAGLDGLAPSLKGTTALAYSKTDPVIAAKILCQYAEGSKGKFSVKAGFLEGKAIDAESVIAMSKLPSKEVLVATVLGTLNAPIAGFANVLAANIRGLAVVINAIAEKKSA